MDTINRNEVIIGFKRGANRRLNAEDECWEAHHLGCQEAIDKLSMGPRT